MRLEFVDMVQVQGGVRARDLTEREVRESSTLPISNGENLLPADSFCTDSSKRGS